MEPRAADPDSGYVLDHWDLDYQPAGTQNPITVIMNSDHILQANFVEGTPDHSLTVNAFGTDYVEGYVPLQIDGQGMGYTPYTDTVSEDSYQIYVDPGPFYGGYSVYWFGYWTINGVQDSNNPVTVYVDEDTTATAWYYHYP